jgi:ATP-dependent protease ClpP protease subunit
MRPCFTFTAKAGDKPAVLALDEEIGFWGTQAKDFRASLDGITSNELVVEINSVGGEVMAGLGMYNMLRQWANDGKTITTRVTGVAASIASVIALAGDKRQMPKNTFAMVHAVSGGAWGTAEDLREAADVVDKIQVSLRNIYVDRMGIDEAKATEIMAKDTWLTAEECLTMGFATELTDAVTATAKFDLARAELPEHVAQVFKAEDTPAEPVVETEPEPEPTIEVPDTPLAEQIVAKAKSLGLEAHGAFFAVAATTMADAEARFTAAREITALCNVVGRPDDAKAHIRASAKIEDVRAALANAMAEADQHTNQTKQVQKESDANRANPGVSTARMWDLHNQRTKKEGR